MYTEYHYTIQWNSLLNVTAHILPFAVHFICGISQYITVEVASSLQQTLKSALSNLLLSAAHVSVSLNTSIFSLFLFLTFFFEILHIPILGFTFPLSPLSV
jgi:hypothetical protein